MSQPAVAGFKTDSSTHGLFHLFYRKFLQLFDHSLDVNAPTLRISTDPSNPISAVIDNTTDTGNIDDKTLRITIAEDDLLTEMIHQELIEVNTALNTISGDTDQIEAKLDTVNTNLVDVEAALSTTNAHLFNITASSDLSNTKLDTVNTNLGDVETLVTSSNTKLDTVNTNLTSLGGKIDDLSQRRPYSRFLTLVSDSAEEDLVGNYSVVNDEAQYISSSNSNYITRITVLVACLNASYSLGTFGGVSPGTANALRIKATIGGNTYHLSDDTHGLTNLWRLKMLSNTYTSEADATTTRAIGHFDFSDHPLPLADGDRIYATLKADYSTLSRFEIAITGFVQV